MRLIINLLTILTLSLTSCASKRTNIIIHGHYFGVYSENQSISCDLFIEQISKNDYLSSNGKNVIEDSINNNCFSLELIVNFSKDDTQKIEFLNFKDAYDGAEGTPISYVDDNHYWFTPYTTLNNEILPQRECYYSIHFKIRDLNLFVYFYATVKEA